MKTPITTLIFDLSEVLVYGIVDLDKMLFPHVQAAPEALLKAMGGRPLFDLFCKRLTEEAYITQLIASQGWAIDMEDLKRLIRQNFHRQVPGMEAVVRALSPHYRLALLSDHAEEWIVYIRKCHPFLEILPHQFFSFQIGTTKRDPATFTEVLGLLQVSPAECLFIDDNPANVASAGKAGLRGIRFTGAADLVEELRALGVWTAETETG